MTNKVALSAAPGGANVSDGSVPQTFLRACETIADEVAARFFTSWKAGATVIGGMVTVEVRAYDANFSLSDLSTTCVFTVDNTTEDMRNAWGNEIPRTLVNNWGQFKVVTDAPQAPPPSDVEPE